MIAKNWWTRGRGMIGRKFEGFDAFVLPQCASVHTWLMGMALDLVFLDGHRRVVRLVPGVKPWRMVWGPRGTETVIELPSGALCGIPINCEDVLQWE